MILRVTNAVSNDGRINAAIAAGMRIEHGVLAYERELNALKWFGYRFMSPYEATRLFYEINLDGRDDYVRREIDIGTQAKLRRPPFSRLTPKPFTQLWKARQRADREGVPYEFYIRFSMNFWGRRKGSGRSNYAPYVNQLHYTRTSEIAWKAEFDKAIVQDLGLEVPRLSAVPALHVSVYSNEPAQRELRELIAHICFSNGASWESEVRKWCYDYPLTTLMSLRRVIPRDRLKGILSGLRQFPATPRPIPPGPVDLRPACFAVPKAIDLASEECRACRFATECRSASSAVVARIRHKTGSDNPRREELRSAANLRQRNYSARKRAAKLVATAAELPTWSALA